MALNKLPSMAPPLTAVSLTMNTSLNSGRLSSKILMVSGEVVAPAGMLSVPVRGMKSLLVAVTGSEFHVTNTYSHAGGSISGSMHLLVYPNLSKCAC